MSSTPSPPAPKEERYQFVDGLRGIAAVAVVSHHLLHNSVLEPTLRTIFPGALQTFCHHGAVGVEIFFVISGFVIAHSLRATKITAGSAGNFILRRQLRLDPPYWVLLALVLALAFIERAAPGLASEPLPDLKTILLNAFYLQNIAGVKPIVGVAWTLCLEVQFYLAFIGSLALGRWLDRRPGSGLSSVSVLLVFGLGAISLALSSQQQVFGAWMLPFWSYFAAGAICKWALSGSVPQWVFLAFGSLFAGAAIWQDTPPLYAGLATILALYGVGRAGHLTGWLGNAPFQYFGRISYSLYLIHLPVLSVVMRGGYKLTGTHPWAALGWFVLAGVCSVVAAQVLYHCVERPSIRFTARLKRRPTDAPRPGIGEANLVVDAIHPAGSKREVVV